MLSGHYTKYENYAKWENITQQKGISVTDLVEKE